MEVTFNLLAVNFHAIVIMSSVQGPVPFISCRFLLYDWRKYETIFYRLILFGQAFGATYGRVKLFRSIMYLCYLLGFLKRD